MDVDFVAGVNDNHEPSTLGIHQVGLRSANGAAGTDRIVRLYVRLSPLFISMCSFPKQGAASTPPRPRFLPTASSGRLPHLYLAAPNTCAEYNTTYWIGTQLHPGDPDAGSTIAAVVTTAVNGSGFGFLFTGLLCLHLGHVFLDKGRLDFLARPYLGVISPLLKVAAPVPPWEEHGTGLKVED